MPAWVGVCVHQHGCLSKHISSTVFAPVIHMEVAFLLRTLANWRLYFIFSHSASSWQKCILGKHWPWLLLLPINPGKVWISLDTLKASLHPFQEQLFKQILLEPDRLFYKNTKIQKIPHCFIAAQVIFINITNNSSAMFQTNVGFRVMKQGDGAKGLFGAIEPGLLYSNSHS